MADTATVPTIAAACGSSQTALDGAATRLLTISEARSTPSRRSIIAGLIGAAVPTAAFSGPNATGNKTEISPDRALLEAEAELVRCTQVATEARKASELANENLWKSLGPCPAELILPKSERIFYTSPMRPRPINPIRLQWVKNFDNNNPDGWGSQAWTAQDLRLAIVSAVDVHGRGGTTPHKVRRYRGLIPIAEKFEARRYECEERFWVKEFSAASHEAEDARSQAERRLNAYTASTVEGLAAIVRNISTFGWESMPSAWISMLLSAAKITGTNLGIAEFDVKRWASELEAAGGRICWPSRYSSGGVYYPVDHAHSPEVKATLSRLSKEQDSNKIQVRLFIEREGVLA